MRPSLLVAGLSLLLAILLSAVYFHFRPPAGADVPLFSAPPVACGTALEACLSEIEGRQIRFRLPRAAAYLKSFPVRVSLQGFGEVDTVVVRFEMRDMNMGYNSVSLARGESGWQGEAILPLCASGRQDWLATVTIQARGMRYQAVFGFEVKAGE